MDNFCSSHKKIDNIHDRLDRILEHLSSIDTTLALQNKQLEIHIKRTELLEQKTEKTDKFIYKQIGAMRLLIFIISTIAACETLVRVFK
jgi:hypothetical protein